MPRAKINTIILAFFITTIRIPALAFILFWFIMQLVFALIGQSGGVAYIAHVGGFLAGAGTAYLWKFISNSYNQRPFVVTKTPKINRAQPLQSPVLEKDVQPEVILGNGFFDVIIHAGGIIEESDIKTEYNKSTDFLIVKVLKYNKSYSINIPNSDNIALEVSSISVNNGIIRIRLGRSS